MSDLNTLMDMGFPQEKAEMALRVTGNKGVEQAMEWLLAYGDQEVPGEDPSVIEKDTETLADESAMQNLSMEALGEEITGEVKAIKCDECNRKFRTDSEIEFHAVKTGHQKFSESTEEIKPLSEEERREQLRKVENLIKQRRAEKAEQEKKEALEKEKNRRKTGQELTHVRQKLQEEEIKQLAELKRREKLEEKLARQRVLEEIERDKQARREKFGMPAANPVIPAADPVPTVPVSPTQTSASSDQSYDECRLQVRLTNGQCLTQAFSPNEQLAAVRLFIEMNRTDGSGPFSLMTNFPKRIFNENDMNAPLSSLGLVPSAVLIVSKQKE